MKERFIERYKTVINKYFDTSGADRDGRLIRNFIVDEYQKILEEEFEMSHKEVRDIYNELYNERYGKKV